MKKLRVLLGFTAILGILAISATPAAAKFVSTNGTGHGSYQLTKGAATFGLETKVGGVAETQISVKCATVANGEWKNRELTKQSEAIEGDHQNLTGQFSTCTEKAGGVTAGATVNKTCELQVAQKGTTFTGGVTSTCVVTQAESGCIITVAATAANTGLSTVTVVNVAVGKEDTSNVTGFVAETNKNCKEIGVTSNTGTFTGAGVAHSDKIV